MTTQKQIIELYKALKTNEQSQLLKELKSCIKPEQEIRSDSSVNHCYYCQSDSLLKYGKRAGKQRYKCKSCSQTFTTKTGTMTHRIKKANKFLAYKEKILEGYEPLRKLATKIGISMQTAFDWRHKILNGIKPKSEKFKGITQMDEVWFNYSQKGRKGLKYSKKRGGSRHRGDNNFKAKLLITADRKSTIDASFVKIGRLKKNDIQRKASGKFAVGATLASDKHGSIVLPQTE